MSKELTHGITEQPGDTCGFIDAAVADVRKALSLLKGYHRMELEDLRKACEDAEWAIDNLSGPRGHLELIRERVKTIRQWGQEWKELALVLDEMKGSA